MGMSTERANVKDVKGGGSSLSFDLLRTDMLLMQLAMMLMFAGLFGILANSLQLSLTLLLPFVGIYFVAHVLGLLLMRWRRFVAILFSKPVLLSVVLLLASIASAICGFVVFSGVSASSFSPTLLCAMAFFMGAHASLMLCFWSELSTSRSDVESVAWHMVPVCVGLLVALVIMFLQEQVRDFVFCALSPSASIVWAFSQALNKHDYAREIIESRNTFYALALRTHLYWIALMLVFGIAYAVGLRCWAVEFGAAALMICLVLAACFPLITSRFRAGLGETSRVYLPLCILVAFCVASAMPQLLPYAMTVAIIFIFYQGLSNISFLANYARAFNESVVYKLSEGRIPPLAGLLVGFVIGEVINQFVPMDNPIVWMAIPCVACMFAVLMYTLQIFNSGNPVNEGVVRNLDDGIEFPWHGDDAQELEAFKQRCQKFAEEKQLTPRETEVFFLLACGYNTVSIAEVLMVSPSTVKTHFYRIYTKVDMHSQQEIIMHMRGRSH